MSSCVKRHASPGLKRQWKVSADLAAKWTLSWASATAINPQRVKTGMVGRSSPGSASFHVRTAEQVPRSWPHSTL